MLPDWAPNGHPLIVHFPIALFVVAVAIDAVLLFVRRRDGFSSLLFGLAGVAAVVAYLTGRYGADVMLVPPHVVPDLNDHADWALRTVWILGLYGVLRAAMWRFVKAWKAGIRIPVFLISLVGLYFLWGTADRGGRLVFEHGLGTAPAAVSMDIVAPPATAGEPLTGTWAWTPDTGLPTLLRGALIEPEDAPIRIEYVEGEAVLAIDGPATVLVADTTNGVQFDARISADGTDGPLRLVHNAADADNYHYLRIGGGQPASQGVRAGGSDRQMGSGRLAPSGWHTLRVVGEGTHYRGYVDGAMVTHGHGDAARPGRVGIRVESGTVYISTLAVTPIG